jgi:hypothetical protein
VLDRRVGERSLRGSDPPVGGLASHPTFRKELRFEVLDAYQVVRPHHAQRPFAGLVPALAGDL